MRGHRLYLAVLILSGCVSALRAEDVASLKDTAQLDLLLYQKEGAASANGQLARAALCSIVAILRRNDAGVPETPGIVCEVRK